MKTEIDLTLSEKVEIDETQYSTLVDIIKKVGVEKFKNDNFLTYDDPENLAEEFINAEIEECITNFIYDMDDQWVDINIIDKIKYTYKETIDDE